MVPGVTGKYNIKLYPEKRHFSGFFSHFSTLFNNEKKCHSNFWIFFLESYGGQFGVLLSKKKVGGKSTFGGPQFPMGDFKFAK